MVSYTIYIQQQDNSVVWLTSSYHDNIESIYHFICIKVIEIYEDQRMMMRIGNSWTAFILPVFRAVQGNCETN